MVLLLPQGGVNDYSHTQKYLTQGTHSKIGVKCAPAELIYKSLIFQKEKKKKEIKKMMGENSQTDEILDLYNSFRCKQQLLKQSISLRLSNTT